MKGFTHDSAQNKSVDWYTPPWIFQRLNLCFDLDPCAPPGGVPWIPVVNYLTTVDNGLKAPWDGKVWLNPPYGRETEKWLKKMHEHRNGIALVFARTDCKWFQEYVAAADRILFLRGRIRFVDGLGVTGNSGPGCGSLLAAWGKECAQILCGLQDLGVLV